MFDIKIPENLEKLILRYGLLDLESNTVEVYIGDYSPAMNDFMSYMNKTTENCKRRLEFKNDVGALLGVWPMSYEKPSAESVVKLMFAFDAIAHEGELPTYTEFTHPDLYREHNDGN